jgi:tRNA threonylcarbamoyladenosine biosynthesis protein TsaB
LIVLAIDTCGAEGSLALVQADADSYSLLEQVALTGRRFAGALVPALRALMGRHDIAVATLEAVAVVHGPGSFTGIRMGVSAAKALHQATGVPVIAVSRLQVLAMTHQADYAALNAGRGEVYLGRYTSSGARERLLSTTEAAAQTGASLVICEESLAVDFPHAQLVAAPSAFDAMLLAHPRLLSDDYEDAATLDGNYVRQPAYVAATS